MQPGIKKNQSNDHGPDLTSVCRALKKKKKDRSSWRKVLKNQSNHIKSQISGSFLNHEPSDQQRAQQKTIGDRRRDRSCVSAKYLVLALIPRVPWLAKALLLCGDPRAVSTTRSRAAFGLRQFQRLTLTNLVRAPGHTCRRRLAGTRVLNTGVSAFVQIVDVVPVRARIA